MSDEVRDEVPDETRQWNPEIAPQATVTNRNGKMKGAPAGALAPMRVIGE